MTWWVLTYLHNARDATALNVLASTNHPCHQIMAWAKYEPARRPIYRIVRGKRVFCGWKYIWDTPNLTEQTQPLDTFEHLFGPITLERHDHVWYLLSSTKKLYERYCQSALIHVLPFPAAAASFYLYFASKLKGIFRTLTFSGPGSLQPYWFPDNDGLLSLSIRQAVLDPFTPYTHRYLIAGAHLYLHHNATPFQPALATTILTWPQAIALTGSPDGQIVWVDPNRHHQGMLHVLWNSAVGCNGSWHLRTLDYGAHWTAHQINAELWNRDVGNIQAGIGKGTSPHPAGDVLYAAINLNIYDKPHLARSIDQGATWTTLETPQPARGAFRPRLYVDPSNQAVLYLSSHYAYQELHRSLDHGNSWTQVQGARSKTISLMTYPQHATLRANPADPTLVRLADRFWIHTSRDFCASWQLTETTPITLYTLRFTPDNPDLLYLATVRSGTAPPPDWKPHVIFVTDNEGATLYPKAGSNAHLADGGGDSIPYNCGGAADDGILILSAP